MKSFLKSMVVRVLALVLTASAAFAQERVPFRQEELDQMLAPIALYPDSLLSQMLMASTYPLEVVQASRWSRANPGLKGQDAVRAVESMDWDPSVKSLTAFPQVLTMMDEKIEWTERLGEAFLAQQADVMDAVQGLRRRAEAAGNLRSSEQMRVSRQDDLVYIEQGSPEIVYVPYYNPTVVYGPWWWPAYPPVYWGPPPGYYYAGPVYSPGFFWGSGIVISAGFFFGHCDWRHRHVTVVQNQVIVNRTTIVNQPVKRVVWEHNPVHRRGVPFRNPEARQRFERARIAADAGRDSDRRDGVRSERRVDDNRTAEFRQRRLEERRNAGQPETHRMQPERNGRLERFAPQVDDRLRPDARRESHNAQPGARSATPQTRPQLTAPQMRPQLAAPQPRTERSAPQARDRLPERNARTDLQRPQFRVPDPRPAVAVPRAAPLARQVAPAPVARPDARPVVANPNGNGRQRAVPEQRARQPEARPFSDGGHASRQNMTMRNSAPAPRPSASGGNPVPRMAHGNHRPEGTARGRGGSPFR
jgi:hypothetical protein